MCQNYYVAALYLVIKVLELPLKEVFTELFYTLRMTVLSAERLHNQLRKVLDNDDQDTWSISQMETQPHKTDPKITVGT